MSYAQEGRALTIETPLGPDRMLLLSVRGREAVSEAYSFHLELVSEDHGILPDAIIGRPVCFGMRMANGVMRLVHGIVARYWSGLERRGQMCPYRMEVVPSLWYLRRAVDCRVYQSLSVPEIARNILDRFGITDIDTTFLKGTYHKLEYSVQYNESYYDYFCRILESAGIFFFFRHEPNRHVLVLADDNAAFQKGPEAEVPFDPDDGGLGVITGWFHRYGVQSFRVAMGDYNHNAPNAFLHLGRWTRLQSLSLPNLDKYEHYEWPGAYSSHADGETVARHRLEELEVGWHTVEGTSTCPGFVAGSRILPTNRPHAHDGGHHYYVLSVEHEARDDSLTAGSGESYRYSNGFRVFPVFSRISGMDKPYRPLRKTPKPRIHGTQTAVVVGPPGEMIHCDQQGRVKVQFHWDRHGPKDDASSCWVRVSQNWAGANFGTVHIPHVGQEVIVSFLEGDPDRPIVVGRVYNAEQKNPLLTKAVSNKTQTVTRDHGGNQILSEGRDGAQHIEFFSPVGNTVIGIGALSPSHPATKVMERFASILPGKGVAPSAGDGGGHPPQPQAAEIGGAGRGPAPTADAPTGRTLRSQQPGAADGGSDGGQAQAPDGDGTPQNNPAARAAFWSSTDGDKITQTDGKEWTVTNDDSYTITNGQSWSIVNGDSFFTNHANSNTWIYGNSKSETHGDQSSLTHGSSSSETHGNATSVTFGNANSQTFGNQASMTLGATEEFYLGATVGVTISAEVTMTIGAAVSINVGASAEIKLANAELSLANSINRVSEQKFAVSRAGISLVKEEADVANTQAAVASESASVTQVDDSVTSMQGGAAQVLDIGARVEQGAVRVEDSLIVQV